MNEDLPQKLDRPSLCQLSKEQLVDIIIEQAIVIQQQAIVIQQLQTMIKELKQQIERLRVSRDLDSKTSSKPPSGDILKKPEKKESEASSEQNSTKRKPGGQPGHQGKTRKGFGRVDYFEILRPEFCTCCGHTEFVSEPVKIETQQVAQLVERPIEIVEYHRHTCKCSHCGNLQT
ncbi:transposase IS66 [Scytonema sp. HK-05]|nr:transposase IS66 [Scytonema sp. HK-05]